MGCGATDRLGHATLGWAVVVRPAPSKRSLRSGVNNLTGHAMFGPNARLWPSAAPWLVDRRLNAGWKKSGRGWKKDAFDGEKKMLLTEKKKMLLTGGKSSVQF